MTAMESLVEQESELEARILGCKEQLVIVCEQLRNTEEDSTGLDQLERDLTELISLTEENLLEVKKQKLLLSLQTGVDTLLQSAAPGNNGDIATQDDSETEDEKIADSHDDLVGMKCRAPLTESWGAVNHHNAVILSRDDDRSGLDFNVKVLFTNPRYEAMKPCPFFMEGKCKFTDDSCHFSHGHQVCFSDLKPFHDPDYSYIAPETRCIAKHSDDLWYDATVSSVGSSLSSISVYIHSLRIKCELKPEDVFPLPDLDESSDISDSELASKDDDDDEMVRVLDWQPSGMTQVLGEWEKHTTGIGSKLLAKMGYIIGEGLGRQSQGRVEPVEIVILPPGKSLDACAALREGKKLKGDGKGKRNRGRLKKEKRARLAAAEAEEETDLFDFLNQKISNPGKSKSRVEPESIKTSGTSRKQLNVQLLKVNEEMKAVGKRIKSLKESLTRNRGNKSMEAHVKEKMKEAQDHLHQLQRQEARLSSTIKSQTDRKKLTEF